MTKRQRQALYRDILTRLHDEAVYLPISYISMMVVSNRSWVTSPTRRSPTEIPFEQIKPGETLMLRYVFAAFCC
ncbi:nickel ABC transporter, substrate-binding protein [Escherichia coli]|uniref:Nickel ABC transporter, substrate-binding protein n=1 Tax=Escherichia coli TaxID=562 RepID=A0A376MLB0_ECOLX|nr:nickel ABC transporter, substrate-binding protein [Escherichia coli]